MEIKFISAPKFSEYFKMVSDEKTFLQSPEFGAWRIGLDEKIHYAHIIEDNQVHGIVIIQEIFTRLKHFLHIPHGPLWIKKNPYWKDFLKAYKKLGAAMRCDFVRISPLLEKKYEKIFQNTGFSPAAIHLVNPEKTWILDITPEDETDILNQMKKTTRYEVRRYLKSDLKVSIGNTPKDLDTFWQIHQATVNRKKFIPFPKASTEKQLESFGDQCQIISVFHDQKAIASGIFIFQPDQAYYHQGASIPSKLPASYAYIWEAIKWARKKNIPTLNFWGICEEHQKKHPWFGLSKFKRGFGGEEKNYPHVHDFPLTYKHTINYYWEKLRRLRRGY